MQNGGSDRIDSPQIGYCVILIATGYPEGDGRPFNGSGRYGTARGIAKRGICSSMRF